MSSFGYTAQGWPATNPAAGPNTNTGPPAPPLAYQATHPGATYDQWMQDPNQSWNNAGVNGADYQRSIGNPLWNTYPGGTAHAAGTAAASVTAQPDYHGSVPPTVFAGVP